MVIFQKPNIQLMVAIVGWALSNFSSGLLHVIGQTIYIPAIIIWAYLEITHGVNKIRKALGVIILLWTVYSLFNLLK